MIKTLIFDNNGVLTTGDNDLTYKNVSTFLKIDAAALKPFWDKEAKPLDEGKITNREFIEFILDKLNLSTDINKLMNVYLNSYQGKQEVQEYVKSLKDKYELAMLTNFGEAFHSCYKRWGLGEIFSDDKIFLSADIHMKKPNDDIYLYVLEKLGRKPEETLFVDDKLANIKTATRLGMNGILFQDLKKLIKDLENILGYNYAK